MVGRSFVFEECWLVCGCFECEEFSFDVEAAGVADEVAVVSDDAVAWDDDGDAVGGVGCGDGACGCSWVEVEALGEFAVADALAVVEVGECVPDVCLEWCALGLDWDVCEGASRAEEVLVDGGGGGADEGVWCVGALGAECVLEFGGALGEACAVGEVEHAELGGGVWLMFDDGDDHVADGGGDLLAAEEWHGGRVSAATGTMCTFIDFDYADTRIHPFDSCLGLADTCANTNARSTPCPPARRTPLARRRT